MNVFRMRSPRLGAGLVALGALLLMVSFSMSAFAAQEESVTICHFPANGGEGETLTINSSGLNGHRNNQGGGLHNGDYFGPCRSDVTTTSSAGASTSSSSAATSSSTSSTSSTSTTATTVADTTVSTAGEPTPSTVPDSTTTTAAVAAAAVETTSTTTATAPTTAPPVVDASNDQGEAGATETADSDEAVDVLPYTGPNTMLAVPGIVLMIFGGIAVFAAGGFSTPEGAHVAAGQGRFSIGLHRGRHQS